MQKSIIYRISLETHLQLCDELWMVMDGGMHEKDGYFGWVIATKTTILGDTRGYVQANPNMIKSLRTEGMPHL
eukprot:5582782-Ditylum_brightwellii.AAC.1